MGCVCSDPKKHEEKGEFPSRRKTDLAESLKNGEEGKVRVGY